MLGHRTVGGGHTCCLLDCETTGDGDETVNHRCDTIEFMGGDENRSARICCVGDQLIDNVSARLIETGMWLIEKPEFRTARCSYGERGTTALSSGKRLDRNVIQTTIDCHTFSSRLLLLHRDSGRLGPEPQVLGNGKVVVQHRSVAHVANSWPHRTSVFEEIETQYLCATALGPQQACAEPQKGGLAGSIRPLQENGLSCFHRQRCSSESGKAPQEHHYLRELNNCHLKKLPLFPGGARVQAAPYRCFLTNSQGSFSSPKAIRTTQI